MQANEERTLKGQCQSTVFLTEVYEQSPKALSLVMRHCHDAADVVLLGTMFLFRKVSHKVTSFRVILRQDVKEKRLHVIIQGLVIKKQLH